jgi:hypothetical protein
MPVYPAFSFDHPVILAYQSVPSGANMTTCGYYITRTQNMVSIFLFFTHLFSFTEKQEIPPGQRQIQHTDAHGSSAPPQSKTAAPTETAASVHTEAPDTAFHVPHRSKHRSYAAAVFAATEFERNSPATETTLPAPVL